MDNWVSVVITSYNRAAYLGVAIESVLAQTYPHFELIIWDDGSTDDSVAIAQQYAACDKRIKLFQAEHQGAGYAFKQAFARATGQYLGSVDSDDYLHQEALAQTVACLEANPQFGMVYTNCIVVDKDGMEKGLHSKCSMVYSKEALLLNFMTFHFRLFRREAYEACGGVDETLNCAVDYDLCLRLSEVTDIYHLSIPLYYYRTHPDSLSQAKRYEQIMASRDVIYRAMERRGLTDKYDLQLELIGKFSLKERPQSS